MQLSVRRFCSFRTTFTRTALSNPKKTQLVSKLTAVVFLLRSVVGFLRGASWRLLASPPT